MEKISYVSISCQNNLLLLSPIAVGTTAFSQLRERGEITKFSKSSAVRMRRFLRTSRAEYKYMHTLTYPFSYPYDGKICKAHLRRYVQELSRENSRKRARGDKNTVPERRFSIFWFLEFQGRGAPHFHLFTNTLFNKEWVSHLWYRIVESDDERHLRSGTRVESLRAGRSGACAYASKYAAKSEQKEIPENFRNTGRFWGVVGDRVSVAAATVVRLVNGEASERVNVRLISLKMAIKAFIDKGEVKELDTRNRPNKIYFLRSSRAITEINSICLLLELTNAFEGVSPTYYLPHHEVSLHAEGLHLEAEAH